MPEVETMCRCIAAAVGGRLRDVIRPRSRLQSIIISPPLGKFRCQARGRTIAAIRRVGKRVVLALDADGPGERACALLVDVLAPVAGELVRERPAAPAKDWGEALLRGAS